MADGHVDEQVFEYLNDVLEPADKAAFEAHVAGCAACAADVVKKREFIGEVQVAFAAPKVSDLELLNRARAEFAKREGTRPKRGVWWLRVFVLGLAVAAVVAFVQLFVAKPEAPPGPRTMYAPAGDDVPHAPRSKRDAG